MTKLLSLQQVNSLDYDDFVSLLGNVIERCPVCVSAVCKQRPFGSVDQLHRSISAFLDQITDDGNQMISY